MSLQINIHREKIVKFCRSHHIRKMAFFGSVLRDDYNSDSDVDVLVEFEQDVRIGLSFFSIERELSDLIGRKVDLNTPGFLSKYYRDEVISKAEVLYEDA